MQAALCFLEIEKIKYFKIVFLIIYNCTYKTPFCKSSHICYHIRSVINLMFFVWEDQSRKLLDVHLDLIYSYAYMHYCDCMFSYVSITFFVITYIEQCLLFL